MLGVLWWSWVGYAWLTSVVDPEEGAVRLAMFGAMAAFLVVALCVPEAFDDSAALFAVRLRRGALRADRRCSPWPAATTPRSATRSGAGWPGSTAVGVGADRGRLVLRRRAPGRALGAGARASTWPGRFFFGSEGWKLVPGHFAERHGLIVIIALGESIVAIGVGRRESAWTPAWSAAAVLGIAVAAALWWLYFDVVALVATRRLAEAEPSDESRTRSPATPTRTCTSRWWPAWC